MIKALQICLVLVLLASSLYGQARTAERLLDTTYSTILALSPILPNGSIRHCLNCKRQGGPIELGGVGDTVGVDIIKLGGTWYGTPRGTASGSGDVAGPSASVDSELPLFSGTGGKTLKRSNPLTGYVKVASGIVSAAVIPEADLPSSINAAKIADGTVSSTEFQFLGNVTSDIQTQLGTKITGPLTGDVTTSGSVATIANNSVTGAKIALGSDAQGDVMFYNGTDWARLPAGASGRFLKTQGAGADPVWEAIPGGGDALTANPLSQFAATTSAQLAGVLTNETGTGVVVFGTGPTLVTPSIGNFTNAIHSHADAVNGGQITDAALSAPVSIAKGGTNATTATAAFNGLDPLTTKGDLVSHDGTNSVRLAVGINGLCLKANSGTSTGLEYGTCGVGTGDFVGPTSSTDNAVVRFDGTTGKLGQNSGVTIDDSNNLAAPGTITTGDGTVAGETKHFELTANGSEYRSWLASDSLTSTVRFRFTDASPTAGQVMKFGAPSSGISDVTFSTPTVSATATLDFANQAAAGCETLTMTVTGAVAGDAVALGVPNGSVVANGMFFAWVSAADTVSVKFCTVVSGDPASGSFRATVVKH